MNAVILLLNCLVLILYLYIRKHHLDLYITDTALKVSRSLYCLTTSISHGVENYFPRLWDTSISDANFPSVAMLVISVRLVLFISGI